jgi:hypothetical protein
MIYFNMTYFHIRFVNFGAQNWINHICACISSTFSTRIYPQNWGAAYTRNLKSYILREKAVILQTMEPMTPVLYVVKPPVETVSSRHHRLSIDSQKSEDCDAIFRIMHTY